MVENVNHPAHYGGGDDPYEVIKVAEAWGFDEDAYLFNVLKYIRRDKGDFLEDLKKARWYLNRKIKRVEEAEPVALGAADPEPVEAMYGVGGAQAVAGTKRVWTDRHGTLWVDVEVTLDTTVGWLLDRVCELSVWRTAENSILWVQGADLNWTKLADPFAKLKDTPGWGGYVRCTGSMYVPKDGGV